MKLLRNGPCHCGSGKEYKWCCIGIDIRKAISPKNVEVALDEVKKLKPIVY
ncbi:SEC-C domain-containing protein [Candidatus Woesearchaeota archaeon]|nr:SEC-C domain-containing protein [Candidatus Woesearchaeota archaeon]